MVGRFGLLAAAAALMSFALAPTAEAQRVVGRCEAPMFNASYVFLEGDRVVQEQDTSNAGTVARDPSGMTFLRLPSRTPEINAYFVTWNGALIEVHREHGWRQVGGCRFDLRFIPPNPYLAVWQAPPMQPNYYVETPAGRVPVPQAFADPRNPFAAPRLVSERQATDCTRQATSAGGLDRQRFSECMMVQMTTEQERAVVQCARIRDQSAMAFCLVGVLGGQRERAAAEGLLRCYQDHRADYSRYPLCMAAGNIPGEAGRLLACVEQQARMGQVTPMGTAVCYGADRFDLNPEVQIILSCAVATGGEPYNFAACAGGQLTARELDKCFAQGVGGENGCFGRNNDILRALNGTGEALAQALGPNNTLAQTWNNTMRDMTQGPGPNHEARRVLRNVGNEVNRGATNVAREVERSLPRIRL